MRLAALSGVTHINEFSHVERVVTLISDSSAAVRRRAAQTVGALRSKDSVVGLNRAHLSGQRIGRRGESCCSLGAGPDRDIKRRTPSISARDDSDSSVRDSASIALRGLNHAD